MNPAAIKANASFMRPGGTIFYDSDSFTQKNFEKAKLKTSDPFMECNLQDYIQVAVPITSMTKEALKDLDIDNKSILRSKNMFALGLICWVFSKPLDYIEGFIKKKFAKSSVVVETNMRVLRAGWNYGFTLEHVTPRYVVHPAEIEKGTYRNINGNLATAWGLLAASQKAGLDLFIGSYPITPATEILQALADRKDLGVKSFQAEDEIAGICTAIGAAFAGKMAVTTTSGPGLALKSEAIGLAVISELPLVIVNVQRGGPSTGLPTKTEQSDLLQALYGRNGESPAVVIAASTPSDCFHYAFMSAKIALERMVPVILLTDGFLGNGSEPWKIPKFSELPTIAPRYATDSATYKPYARDEETLAREWAYPGMAGFQHIIGGLEKDVKGNVSHDPLNHQKMVNIRDAKVKRVVEMVPDLEVYGDQQGDLLVVGWGGTFGYMESAVREMRLKGTKIGLAHFNYINPLPANTASIFGNFKKIVVCELNLGQFASYLRDKVPGFTYNQYNKVQGLPFTIKDLVENFEKLLEE